MVIVEAKDLTYTYPNAEKPALDDVSFEIQKGEFVILTGPSGCGKTSLCRCLNGLIPHFYQGELKGKIVVNGLNVVDHPIHELAMCVGLVFQNPENQLFALSVEKDVAFGLENLGIPRKEMRERVNWAMETAGIMDLAERAPHELSGGQQQRVAIASIMAMNPEILVLDEPTSFLDPVGAKKIFGVISKLNESLDVTVILIEHRLDLVARYANHVVVMDAGKIILDGEPREVLNSEKTRMLGVGIPKVTRLFQLLEEQKALHSKKVPIMAEEMGELVRGALKA
ncbi:ATP-binding cassette domain-containing protein [Candidatus Bathyarchaeota archaeon]|nr:MAG: ATP-binding cassette domain-containing protein [Candidatus Bathyarchaeota archaeon]